MEQFRVDDPDLAGGAARPEAERLQAALEALAARDQVLADRSRRLVALEGAAAQLTALGRRLEEAEAELAALRRARSAEAAAREERIADLERRLAERSAASGDLAHAVAGLQKDLEIERRRNARLAARREDGAAGEAARLHQELNAALQRAATLDRELSELRRLAGPAATYAHWERWFRRKLADRETEDLARADRALREQRSALTEKERLISRLTDRLGALGEAREVADDLKTIVGIGPVIEELLHGLGITTFEQLAALSAEEVDRIAALLGAFPDRIRRDRWVEQAADLAARHPRLGSGISFG